MTDLKSYLFLQNVGTSGYEDFARQVVENYNFLFNTRNEAGNAQSKKIISHLSTLYRDNSMLNGERADININLIISDGFHYKMHQIIRTPGLSKDEILKQAKEFNQIGPKIGLQQISERSLKKEIKNPSKSLFEMSTSSKSIKNYINIIFNKKYFKLLISNFKLNFYKLSFSNCRLI